MSRHWQKPLVVSKLSNEPALYLRSDGEYSGHDLAEQLRVARKILVVDDRNGTRHAVSYCLKRDGYEVVSVSDGLQAMADSRKTLSILFYLTSQCREWMVLL